MDINTAVPSADPADNDVKLLHKMGYAQELSRRMGAFSNFAVSFSLICILSGGITSFQMGLSAAGGASIGLGWPLGSLFALVVAAAMAQIASSYPTAGGLYHWSSILGGGTYDPFFRTLIAPMFGVNPDSLGWWQQTLFLTVITASQAFLNHRGIRITSKITDLSGYLIFVVTIMLVVSLLVYSPVKIDLSRLYTFTNFTGVDGGAWPKQTIAMAFLSGLLLTAYTITGFDASAHTSEETHQAARNVPRGIVGSVFWSTTFGYVMVCAFVLVMPDISAGVKQGTGFFEAILAPIPGPLRILIELLMFFINYVCGLAAVTSTSRMMFAFARDGGLPGSKWLRKVNAAHRTPGAAIWTSAVLAIVVTLYGDAFTVLSAGSAVFLFISYAMPIAAGIFAEGRTWKEKGPFQLGMLSKPFAVAAVFGALVLAYVGMQPPNQKVVYVIVGLLAVLLTIWYGAGVRKSFAGPPIGKVSKEREQELSGMEGQLGES
jgi:amino acid transporter